ncbi:MAG TPA: hypothetical protein VLT32_11540 [Candidatus Sulfomarinibacteraceae bacterium]|nr:hypothetical protein [Candidatus Sulfomarinibacteraceae bacterium]
MTVRWALPAAMIAVGWSVAVAAGEGPVWPPAGVRSPAEVVWQGAVGDLRPGGLGRLLRAIAGAERRQQAWQLPRPVSVAVAGDRFFVVDTARGEVLGAGSDGGSAVRLRLPEGTEPVAVAVAAHGERVLVADRAGGSVLAFDLDGTARGERVPNGVVRRIGGLGTCANGDLLVTDAESGQVVRFRSDGSVSARTGDVGGGDGQFNTPTAVVEAPDGSIWVLDTFNFRLQRLDPELRYLSQFGQHGDGSGHFALPKGLAVDPDGHLHVTDARFDVIQVFDEEGRLLLIVGGHGAGPGGLWNPAGIAIDGEGRVAVADTGNRRVQLLRYRERGGGP